MDAGKAFLGGALLGGLSKYGQLQDEQRKFRVDEMKAEAEMNRRMNLARAVKGMEESGALDAQGMPVTREQLDAMSPEQRSALKGPLAVKEAELGAQFGFKPSGFLDPKTKAPLTNKEVEAYKAANNGSAEGLISENQYKEMTAETQFNRSLAKQEASQKRSFDYQLKKLKEKEELDEKKATVKEQAALDKQVDTLGMDILKNATLTVQAARKDPAKAEEAGLPSNQTLIKQLTILDQLETAKASVKPDVYNKLVTRSPELTKMEKMSYLIGKMAETGSVIPEGVASKAGIEGKDYKDMLEIMKLRGQAESVVSTPGFWGSLLGDEPEEVGIRVRR